MLAMMKVVSSIPNTAMAINKLLLTEGSSKEIVFVLLFKFG